MRIALAVSLFATERHDSGATVPNTNGALDGNAHSHASEPPAARESPRFKRHLLRANDADCIENNRCSPSAFPSAAFPHTDDRAPARIVESIESRITP